MKILQGITGLTTETDREEWLSVVDDFHIHSRFEDLDPAVPLLIYSNMASRMIVKWINDKNPIIAMNRPHLAGWAKQYTMGARRFSVNGYACTRWGTASHERFHLLNIPRQPWKVREIQRVLIAPPGKLLWFWHGIDPQIWAEQQAAFLPTKR
jgi:hypothetical protein